MSDTPLVIPELENKFVDYRQEIWGDSFTWSWERPPNQVEWVVIHHSVTIHEATPDDIALLHKARGWGGIGYHFVITKDGKVYYVGDVGTARANVLNMNEKVIGICLVGDFTQHNPSDEQIISAHYLCKFFLDNTAVWPQLKTWENSVVGHKELQVTACPGTNWKGVGDSIFERIKNKIPYTPPTEPENPCKKELETISGLEKIVANLELEAKNLTSENSNLTLKVAELAEAEGICQTNLKSANEALFEAEKQLKIANQYAEALGQGWGKSFIAWVKKVLHGK